MGYFLVKSFYDDFVLERDTKRLLAYYKHVLPGSMQAGDEHGARYTCYKYRHKKDKLWKNLERKYSEPVLSTKEYEAMFLAAAEEVMRSQEDDEGETVDLDDEEEKSNEEL